MVGDSAVEITIGSRPRRCITSITRRLARHDLKDRLTRVNVIERVMDQMSGSSGIWTGWMEEAEEKEKEVEEEEEVGVEEGEEEVEEEVDEEKEEEVVEEEQEKR